MIDLTNPLKRVRELVVLASALVFVTTFANTVCAQSEEELQQEFYEYAISHSEAELTEYFNARVTQMTVDAYWRDFNLSLLLGPGNQSQCVLAKRRVCDIAYFEDLATLAGESAVLGAACAALALANPLASAACMAAVVLRHAARLTAIGLKKDACYDRASIECNSVGQVCIPQPQIVAWCDDYNFATCHCDGTIEKSPIIIDVLGNGFDLTDRAGGVHFDITGTGNRELISWTKAQSDDAFLVFDRNGNGTIDNGEELFGNFTPQPVPLDGHERNGFWALRGLDSNSDAVISKLDSMFASLRLWQDSNHNGVSEPGELKTLKDLGLKSIDLDYRESRKKDRHGNRFRYRAKVKDFRDAQLGRWAWDVFLLDH